jgi:hypothetical protein
MRDAVALALRGGLLREDVGLGDDAYDDSLVVHDGEARDAVLGQQERCLLERGLRPRRDDRARHHLMHLHLSSLLSPVPAGSARGGLGASVPVPIGPAVFPQELSARSGRPGRSIVRPDPMERLAVSGPVVVLPVLGPSR